MSHRNLFIAILVIVALILVAGALYFFFSSEPLPDEATFREEYALILKDYAGNDVKLSDFRREILIVYAWASWCPYCGKELEYLAELKGRYGDELSIVAVNRAEPLVEAKDFTDKLQGMDRLVRSNPRPAIAARSTQRQIRSPNRSPISTG